MQGAGRGNLDVLCGVGCAKSAVEGHGGSLGVVLG